VNFQTDYQKELVTAWRAVLRDQTILWVKDVITPANTNDPYAKTVETITSGTLTGIVGWGTENVLAQLSRGGIVTTSDCSFVLSSGSGISILEQGNTYFEVSNIKLRVVNYTMVDETGEIIVSLNKIKS